ncbi:MFS transporter [Sphingosinicellaceae bacterium]|nr:MFS transporter [Sphingosinicellaceae bacterium]
MADGRGPTASIETADSFETAVVPGAETGAGGLPTPRRYWAVVAIWLAMAMSVLDSSIANIALPTIARDLGASAASSIWVVNAYQIAITSSLLPIAMLGDIVGHRRIYMVGLSVFAVASIGCVLSQSLGDIAMARFVQGFGAAGVMAINGALVRFTYPRSMLGRGIGYNALVVAVSSAAGPSIAAAILSVASWRWLFAVNVPLGLLSLVIGYRCLPITPRSGNRFDIWSALLNATTFGAVFLAASDVAHSTLSLLTALEVAVAVAAGVLLVRRSRGQVAPMVPLDLLRLPILRLSYATSSLSFAAMMMAGVSLPFILQARFGFDRVETGLLMTPLPLGVAVAAPIAGRLVERFPAGLLGGIGLGLLALSLAGLGLLQPGSGAPMLVALTALGGIGFGLFQTPNNRTMLGLAPPERSGAAAGMLATARLAGQTAGALMVALLFHRAGPASIVPLWSAAAIALAAAAVSMGRLRHRPSLPGRSAPGTGQGFTNR